MQDPFLAAGLVILAFLVSIPCGYVREYFRKFSIMWFVLVHVPIPLVYHMRTMAGISWQIVPFTLAGAVAGQMVGGWYKRRAVHGRKAPQRQP